MRAVARGQLGNDLYSGRRSFPFVQKRKYWFIIAFICIAVSVITLLVRGLNLGIEFTGGSQFTVSNTANLDQKPAAAVLSDQIGDKTALIVQVGDSSLRIQSSSANLEASQINKVRTELAKAYGVAEENVTSTVIGPTWGSGISAQALKGFIVFLILVMLGLTLYFRSWRNAVGAVLALFNDLVVTVGVYALLGFEVTPSTVIGLLTILGYSLYDTVVVFDKVRENSARLLSQDSYTFGEAVNLAVNQTLIRSLNTSVTSIFPVASILFIGSLILGAGTLRDIALVMFVGMILSTISSLFIASPLAVQLAEMDSSIREHTEKVMKVRAEREARRSLGDMKDGEENYANVTAVGGVIRRPGQHLGASAQPKRKNRKKK